MCLIDWNGLMMVYFAYRSGQQITILDDGFCSAIDEHADLI
jgi:hypothetical protein